MPPKSNTSHRREFKRDFAKNLRTTATDAERILWSLLRAKQFAHLRFRRQQPIGPYIADFYCAAAKLIVEIDGDQHGADANMEYDEARTRFLSARGYRVLRFPNGDVLKNLDAVLDGIWHALKDCGRPLPDPAPLRSTGSTLPQGEGSHMSIRP